MGNFLNIFFSSWMKGLVGLYGISGKKWLKPIFLYLTSKRYIGFWWNLAKCFKIWFPLTWCRSICLENVMLMFALQFLFLNQVYVLKMDKVSLICEVFCHFRLFEAIIFQTLCWTFMKFDQNFYYMECFFLFLFEAGDHR